MYLIKTLDSLEEMFFQSIFFLFFCSYLTFLMKKESNYIGKWKKRNLFSLNCFYHCVHDNNDNAQIVVCNLPGVIVLEESVYPEGPCFGTSTYIGKLHTKCTTT